MEASFDLVYSYDLFLLLFESADSFLVVCEDAGDVIHCDASMMLCYRLKIAALVMNWRGGV